MGILETKILKKIKTEIELKFPEMKDVEPDEDKITIEPEPMLYKKLGVSSPKKFIGNEIIKLIFKKSITTEDGFKMQRIVRVLVNKSGEIIKISTSK